MDAVLTLRWCHTMSQVLVQLDLPRDWRRFRLPAALDERLQ
jgi:hypothetical protein